MFSRTETRGYVCVWLRVPLPINFTETDSVGFFLLLALSCMSAFTLNLSTYLCTLYNSPLTTSVVARAKTILQVRKSLS